MDLHVVGPAATPGERAAVDAVLDPEIGPATGWTGGERALGQRSSPLGGRNKIGAGGDPAPISLERIGDTAREQQQARRRLAMTSRRETAGGGTAAPAGLERDLAPPLGRRR